MNLLKQYTTLIIILLLSIFSTENTFAFKLSTYADTSVLNDGKWIKVKVEKSGMHLITTSDLKNWGFNDPSKVRVYGYGGAVLSDVLDSYTDDLPITASICTDRGIFFYAQGPETWGTSTSNYLRHTLNPYSSYGYYFLSDKACEEKKIPKIGSAHANNPANTFMECLYHEKELSSPGETGRMLLGEDFKYNNNQTFNFELPDIVEDSKVWMECSFITKTYSAPSTLSFTVNGEPLTQTSADRIASSANSSYTHGTQGLTRKTFNIEGNKLTLGINFSSTGTIHLANLNYIVINYTRKNKLINGHLNFRATTSQIKLEGATTNTYVWDVTDVTNIRQLKTASTDGGVVWTNEYVGKRQYAAWDENATLPSPTFVSNINNQNIHGRQTPDMVIITLSDWKNQAERLAELHRNSSDSLDVFVVDCEDVYNEFSSGAQDINGLRKMLKMFWDRGEASGNKLKYALLMGRSTYDNRHSSSAMQALGHKTLVSWQSVSSLDDNTSFTTDDILAFLKDNSGNTMKSDYYCIAVGRIPARSVNDAKLAVDKIYEYVNESPKSEWKNQVLLIADDQDNGIHMEQTESGYNKAITTQSGQQLFYNKLYTDAYTLISNSYPDARKQMLRKLEEGVMWWSYVGHANPTSWSHEGLMTYNDINNMYLKHYPVLYAATCDFMRWDGNTISGCEILYFTNGGGIIAAISAGRPVYIADNGILTNAMYEYAFTRDIEGKYMTIGEIYRQAKNGLKLNNSPVSNDNKLRYALMGDPALRLLTPSPSIKIESINSKDFNPDEQPTLMALQDVVLNGSIYDENGNKMTNFNGIISATLYDAEKSTTTNGNGKDGKAITFESQGDRLFACRDSVKNGEFRLKISMPSEIANNFRPAALNMYAYSNDGKEALGCNRDLYVFGYDDTAQKDTIPPVIESIFLNHETFKNKGKVNESPMLLALISDNKAINLSTAGIGHQMTLTLDEQKTFTDVSQYYTPASDGSSSGEIAYPIENLPNGHHSLKLRIWDTSGNSASETIEFFVEEGLKPIIYDVYCDANPASIETKFYITHNRPEAQATVKLTVYNLLGQPVWTTTETGRNDMFRSFPITWDLTNMAGQRVKRGIYLYKAEISTDGEQFDTASKKIAVTAP